MTPREQEFIKKLRATFKTEADEHIQAVSEGLLELEKTPDSSANPGRLELVFRHVHSLKGAARAANFAEIETICQSLESVFSAWKRGAARPVPEDFDLFHHAVDLIGKHLRTTDCSASDSADVSALTQRLDLLASGETSDIASDEKDRAPRPAPPARPLPAAEFAPAKPEPPAPRNTLPPAPTASQRPPSPVHTSAVSTERPALVETIRVSTGKLDRMLVDAQEMLTVKQRMGRRTAELRRIEANFESWTKQWARIQSSLATLRGAIPARDRAEATRNEFLDWNFGYIRTLEESIRLLGKSATEDERVVQRLVDDLLDDSKRLLMLPFSTLAGRLPSMVRDLARAQGKEVELVVVGGDVEMDKRILEEMKDPLLHLVRNSIDHGVENPDIRAGRGKPRRRDITITVESLDGNKIEILVGDDGAGINAARVLDAARRRGMVSEAEAQQLDEAKTLEASFSNPRCPPARSSRRNSPAAGWDSPSFAKRRRNSAASSSPKTCGHPAPFSASPFRSR